ncbi:MAG: hypothetical protein Q7T04_08035 [Dehalococcoidia bacterium]|nr:hypothetical protein [Dehalococcoidia bacterium]
MGKEVFHHKSSAMAAEQRLNLTQRYLWRIVAKICSAVKEKYGEEGLQTIYNALESWPNHRSAVVKSGITPGEGTLGDLITKLYDPGDEMLFTMTKHRIITEEPDADHLLYKIQECNVKDVVQRECPEMCSYVVRGIEQGLAKQVNPNIKVSGNRFLANGHDACYIQLEMTKPKAAKKPAAKAPAKKQK